MNADPNIGRVLEGKYEIIRALGQGGMGVVYEARHRLIHRRLAVKLLHEEYAQESNVAERFRREAQAASAIGHDHIVDVTDMGFTDKGELFIVMEYLEGMDLSDFLQDNNKLSPKHACHIMIQVLSALEAAHAKGIIHRDLKPANIFIIRNREGHDYVKLVDFGISKIRQSEEDMHRGLTRTGELLGTPPFMSPEQARGETNIGPQSDIFSAGLILYRLLTGRTAFEDPALTMLLLKIISETPLKPQDIAPEIPAELSDAVMRAVAKEPANRFPDAASFRRVLTRFSPDTPGQTGLSVTRLKEPSRRFSLKTGRKSIGDETPIQMTKTHRREKRSKLAVVLTALSASAILGGAAFFFFKMSPSQKPSPLNVPHSTPAERAPSSQTNVSPNNVEKTVSSTDVKAGPTSTVPSFIMLEVNVLPAHAAVSVDGVARGNGSMVLQVNQDNQSHRVQVSAPEFSVFQQNVSFDRDIRLAVRLLPLLKPKSQSASKPRKASDKTDSKTAENPQADSSPKGKPENPLNDTAKARPVRQIDEVNPW